MEADHDDAGADRLERFEDDREADGGPGEEIAAVVVFTTDEELELQEITEAVQAAQLLRIPDLAERRDALAEKMAAMNFADIDEVIREHTSLMPTIEDMLGGHKIHRRGEARACNLCGTPDHDCPELGGGDA